MDLEAFESRILPFKNKLFRFALRFVGSEDEAKDIVQEVFIRVWNSRATMGEVQNWEAWCMRITRNLSLDRLRSMSKRRTRPIEEGSDVRHEGPTPHESTENGECMQKIERMITSLPEKQRQVMHLRDVEGYSYQEICDILELNMSQVKVYLFRARNAVREKLTKIDAYGL